MIYREYKWLRWFIRGFRVWRFVDMFFGGLRKGNREFTCLFGKGPAQRIRLAWRDSRIDVRRTPRF